MGRLAAALAVLVVLSLVGPAAGGAALASTSLPTPRATVKPEESVGGPDLARMSLVIHRPTGVPKPPKMPNVAWLVADMDSGDVLVAKAAHARLRPASTLKILTALVLLPEIDKRRKYRVTKADVQVDGSRVGLVPGQRYTRTQLFNGLLMASGNDAAYALARIAGGRTRTIGAMADEAERLGALDTTPEDPAGLDVKGQHSSAYDLALIAREAMKRSDFRDIVARKQASIPGYPKGRAGPRRFDIGNHNHLLYNYNGTIGVKNGYTTKANHTLVTAVHRGERTYLVTQMGGTTSSWHPTADLYDWVFRYGRKLEPVGRLVEPGEVSASSDTSTTGSSSASVTAAGTSPVATAAEDPQGGTGDVAWLVSGAGLVGLLGCAAVVLAVGMRGRGRTRPVVEGRRSGRHRG
jgi:D-alanyl-D-alanine carboxypeptidase (penicillin-binding protein 5/6)